MSASEWMITPALPPSSSVIFFIPAFALSLKPTAALPVKESFFILSSVTNFSARRFEQGITLSAPAGKPASVAISPRRMAVIGVLGAGFNIIVFQDAMAGATL